jgi:hypothetical protein
MESLRDRLDAAMRLAVVGQQVPAEWPALLAEVEEQECREGGFWGRACARLLEANKHLREALEKYGRHKPICSSGASARRRRKCDCGLDAALTRPVEAVPPAARVDPREALRAFGTVVAKYDPAIFALHWPTLAALAERPAGRPDEALLAFVRKVSLDCDNDPSCAKSYGNSGPYCSEHGINYHAEEARRLLARYERPAGREEARDGA